MALLITFIVLTVGGLSAAMYFWWNAGRAARLLRRGDEMLAAQRVEEARRYYTAAQNHLGYTPGETATRGELFFRLAALAAARGDDGEMLELLRFALELKPSLHWDEFSAFAASAGGQTSPMQKLEFRKLELNHLFPRVLSRKSPIHGCSFTIDVQADGTQRLALSYTHGATRRDGTRTLYADAEAMRRAIEDEHARLGDRLVDFLRSRRALGDFVSITIHGRTAPQLAVLRLPPDEDRSSVAFATEIAVLPAEGGPRTSSLVVLDQRDLLVFQRAGRQ